MATATIPNTFTNGTNADANLVNANFSYLSSWLNTNVIQPNVANFSVFPTLPSSAPTSDYQAVHKNYVDLFMPAGIITQYVGTAAPAGWRLCDGGLYNAADTTYARLWAAIGTTYGGSGINSFAVPDLKGRVPVGYGAGAGLTARSLNDKSGFETHVLTEAELASHTHTPTNHNHGYTVAGFSTTNSGSSGVIHTHGGVVTGTSDTYGNNESLDHQHSYTAGSNSASTTGGASVLSASSTGGNAAHNNMQPFIVVSYIIKL
jgi:microcystin-dependent protein